MAATRSAHKRVRQSPRRRSWLAWRLSGLCALVLAAIGCTRAYYRDYADSDVYGILKERLFDWRWRVPERPVEADPHSRMGDLNDPNHVPIVPDEVAARQFQVSSRFPFEYRFWRKRGDTPIEDLSWQPYIPTEPDGKVLLSKDSVMRLGISNSRDYQTNFENLYLTALSLTLARFQFMIMGFSNWGVTYLPLAAGGVATAPSVTTATGATTSTTGTTTGSTSTAGTSTSTSTATATGTTATTGGTAAARAPSATTPSGSLPSLNNQLLLSASNGFNLMFMTGAQLMVNLANALVFEFSNRGVQLATPSLTVSLAQPLMRGAWARIVTQPLSLQERGVLYQLRSFAEYRRAFYVNLVAGGGYLGLVNQLQSIRNLDVNVKSYKRNLDIYDAEVKAGIRAILERDTIAQTYQQNLFTLISSQAALQTSLDAFKITLGLPTELDVRLDDSILEPFRLNDSRLDTMRERSEELFLSLLQKDVLTRAEMREAGQRLKKALDVLEQVHDEVLVEMGRWKARLKETQRRGFSGPEAEHNRELFDREERLAKDVEGALLETDQEIDDDQAKLSAFLAKLDSTPPEDATKALRDLVGKGFRARLSAVNVAQTQVRVFLIQLPEVNLTVNQAIAVALGNRLDLQNSLGQVTDAWRQVEVDANALQGFLNFNYNGVFNSAPNHDTLFRFDASNSIQSVNLEFEAPINRRVERNQYRGDQILYQRARRAYMLARDTVVQDIRLDMRQIVLQRRSFEINREQVIIAARQLEQAEYDLRTSTEAGQSLTLLLQMALAAVLQSSNNLISTWVSYETARMSLYRDFDLMDIDANGVWTNENDPTAIQIALRNAECAPALSLTIPARIPDLGPNVSNDSVFYIDSQPGGRPTSVPDAARTPYDEGPFRSSEFPEQPVPSPRPGPPAAPSPFAPARPGP